MSARKNDRARHPERGNRSLRFLDRYAGIPLVAVLRLLKPRRRVRRDRTLQRAAFLQTAAIGDTIISSAVVQDFRKAFPSSHITFFCGSSNHEIARLIPGVDDVVQLPIMSPLAAIGRIRRSGVFDIWFDLGPWPRLNAVYSFVARTALTVGFRTEGQYRHYLYDEEVRHSSKRHEVENYRELLRAAGIRDTTSLPALVTAAAPPLLRNIVIHMFPGGSRSYLKEWPGDRWVDLIDLLIERDWTVSLTGTMANREQAEKIRSLIRKKERVQVVAGLLSLQEVSGLLKASRLTISVDTGIMHLASALGCNLISLHGPTSPERWGPLNANSIALHSGLACSPCLSLGFEDVCREASCMDCITVDQVAAASLKLLG